MKSKPTMVILKLNVLSNTVNVYSLTGRKLKHVQVHSWFFYCDHFLNEWNRLQQLYNLREDSNRGLLVITWKTFGRFLYNLIPVPIGIVSRGGHERGHVQLLREWYKSWDLLVQACRVLEPLQNTQQAGQRRADVIYYMY